MPNCWRLQGKKPMQLHRECYVSTCRSLLQVKLCVSCAQVDALASLAVAATAASAHGPICRPVFLDPTVVGPNVSDGLLFHIWHHAAAWQGRVQLCCATIRGSHIPSALPAFHPVHCNHSA